MRLETGNSVPDGAVHGSRLGVEALFPEVYTSLRAIAAEKLRDEPAGHTLQPTALVHEVFLRLAEQERARWNDSAHLLAVAAHMLRRVLIDHARKRLRRKRDSRRRVPLGNHVPASEGQWEQAIALDDALRRLEEIDARMAGLVELRVFGGLTLEQAAGTLGVSRATAARDWHAARAWLSKEMRGVRRAEP
jgi:RNA polymerase sigma-70 factor, ECF subfamily